VVPYVEGHFLEPKKSVVLGGTGVLTRAEDEIERYDDHVGGGLTVGRGGCVECLLKNVDDNDDMYRFYSQRGSSSFMYARN
jgi:hypothetical protein